MAERLNAAVLKTVIGAILSGVRIPLLPPFFMSMEEQGLINQLEKLKTECFTCQRCELYKYRTNIVFAEGNPTSKIMLIGEAPGENEDLQGKPFVGRSGQLLDKILESVGLSRKTNVYICNTIKCRPPNNRNPLPVEKESCRNYLDKQIELINPKIILLCGAVAVASILPDNKLGITKIHGNWFDYNGMLVMPIYHPAYLLRNPSKEVGSPKWQMYQDMKKIKAKYLELIKDEK